MFAPPGKKRQFMGNEIAQWREWNHDRSLDWHLTQWKDHEGGLHATGGPHRAAECARARVPPPPPGRPHPSPEARSRAPPDRLRLARLRVAGAERLGEQQHRLPPP